MRYFSTILISSLIATVISIFLYFNYSKVFTPNNYNQDTNLEINHLLHTHNHSGFCAFDKIQDNLSLPEKRLQDQLEQQLQNLLQRGYPSTNGRALYTIPVVVHVVHNNGSGNIPNTQVQDAIQHLNDAFANVGVYNPTTGVDVEVQFCLAQRDPNGNTTNGITNTVSTLTSLNRNTQDLALKNLSRWNPLDYVNIWVVDNIQGGVAGYAYFPSSHGNNLDGIVLEATYMGTTTDNSKVLVHEMGHYLGLYHTFQGGCTNNDCLVDGDRVCDTPPDNTTARPPCISNQNSCTTDEDDVSVNNPFRPIANGGLGDQPDQKENYMDYSNLSCYDRFTQGQKVRTHFFLTGVRASLLASQGCVPPCTTPINVAFTASAMTVVAGTSVNFNNTTTGASAYEWFNNSSSFATTLNSSFLFNTIGTFNIVLEATNGDPNCTKRDSLTITVTCNAQAAFIANTTQVSPGDAVVFNNTSTGATGYQWFVNNVVQGTTTNFNFTFPVVGTYDIFLVATDGVCTDTSAATIITVTINALAQTGLPVWPLAPYGNIVPSAIDWRNPIPTTSSIPTTTNGGQTGAGFNNCGQLAFYVLHTGNGNANNLFIYKADGTPLLTNTTINGPGLNAVKALQEIQVIKVPQANDEWYVFYKKWVTDVGATANNGAYVPANWLYSRIQYTGGNSLTVLQRDIPLLDGGGVARTYTDGAAVSRTAAGLSNQHYLYLCRRTVNVNNISLDRFLITSTGITWTANTGNVFANWWSLTVAGSPIELNSAEDKIAVSCRNESINYTDIVLFNATLFNAASVQSISLGDLVLQPDGTPNDQSNVLNTSGVVSTIASNTIYPLSFLSNMESRVSEIEFSPNGRFLYFTNGGGTGSGGTNLTYLGQIDLGMVPFELRLQIQTVPNSLNMATGAGCSISNATCLAAWQGIRSIESCYDGNLYFTKRITNTLYVIPNPNNFMPQNLVPSNIDLSTATEPNIDNIPGALFAIPDQIDGFNYLSSQYREVELIVQKLDCDGICDTSNYTLEMVDSSGSVVESFVIENCPDTIKFCADTSLVYELRNTLGISYPYAVYLGQTLYPAGDTLFDFSVRIGCSEICDNGIDDDGDGLVDCYDPDCCGNQSCDPVFYTSCPSIPCSYSVIDTTIAIQQRLQSTTDYMVFHTPVFGDIDLDGDTEVILLKYNTNNNAIDIVDGLTGAVETTIPTSTFGDNRVATVAIGDLDVNDGGLAEIVVGRGDGFIQTFNHDGTNLWTSSAPIQHNTFYNGTSLTPNLVDFNNDGFPEVYAGYYILNGQTGTVMGSGTSGRGAIILGNQALGVSQTVAIDVLPDNYCTNCQGLELVAGNTVYSVAINTTTNIASLNAEISTTGLDGFTAVADWDNDGDLDGIITTAVNQTTSRLYAWDLQTTTVLGSIDIPIGTTTGPQPSVIGVGRANIADLDGDGQVEATFCTSFKFVAIENNFTQKWSIATTDGSGVTGGTVYDFNADGTYEVVYRDYENLRILNGTTGANIVIQPCRSGTTIEYPTIGDIDGNGTTEILTMCNITQPTGTTYIGKFTVFESMNTPWVPTRDIWNQYTYHYTNINDDLSVPIHQQNHHLVGDSIVLNNFLNQYSNPEFPAADATVSVDSIWCSGDSVTIVATICNNGSNTLPYQTPITIYDANPTLNASASPLTTPHPIGQSIEVDSCLVVNIKAHQSALTYYIVVNDDASLAPIYNLSSDFPVTSIPECDFTNNIDSITFITNLPPLDLGPDTTLCENSVLTLNAGAGYDRYLWQNNSSDSILTADSSGLYWVQVIGECGDTLRDSIIINIDTVGLVTLIDTSICQGDTLSLNLNATYTYQWFPNQDISCNNCPNPQFYPTVSRTYTLVTNNSIGCFSVDTFRITIDTCNISTTIDTLICQGDLFAYQGNNLPPGTVDTFLYTSSTGLDSFVFVNVLGLDTFNIVIDTMVCLGDSLTFGGQQLLPNTSTVFNLQTIAGCDSIITVNITGLDTFNTTIDTAICAGDNLIYNGQTLLAGTTTTFNLQTITGCDSIITVNVASLDTFNIVIDTAICAGDNIIYNGQTLNAGTSTIFNLQTIAGCDSIITVNVTSLDTFNIVIDTAICAGDNLIYNGQTLNTGTSTVFNLQTIAGCDSIITVNVTSLDTFNMVIDTVVCAGNTLSFGGQQLQANTSTIFNLQTIAGCDSTVTVNVSSLDTFNLRIDTIICVGASLVYNGQTLLAGTTTTFNFQTIAGCDSMVIINVLSVPITFTVSNTDASCNGASDGSATINASGGVGGFSYAWNSSAQTTATATGLPAGLHCVTVTDGNGCTVDTCIQVDEPAGFSNISFSTIDVSCFGGSNGQATITLSGGIGSYSYNWSTIPAQTTATATGLDANTHSVTVTDANGCTVTANVIITEPTALQLSITADSVQCKNGSDGSVTALVTGGTFPYTYQWDPSTGGPGQVTATASGLSVGTYSVTVTDFNGCTIVGSQIIFEPATVLTAAIINQLNPSCNGVCDGSIEVDAQGATPNYTYQWSNGQNTSIATNVCAGLHTVTVTDANGCTITTGSVLTEPTAITLNPQVLSNYNGAAISCTGAADGSVGVVVAGGSGGYSFVWSPQGQNTANITNLVAGTYCVTVTDIAGCSMDTCITIVDPVQLAATFTAVDVLCHGDANGQILVNATPGTGTLGVNGYEYRITGPGQVGNIFSSVNNYNNLIAGSYTIFVRDGNNCEITLPISIGEPDSVLIDSVVVTDALCNGTATGTATAYPSGGIGGFTYIWSTIPVQTTATATGLAVGVYSVTVADANGCDRVDVFNVDEPTLLTGSITANPINCFGGTTSATALGSGGTPAGLTGYVYLWDDGTSLATTIGLSAGVHCVTITDNNACTYVECVTITQPSTAVTASITTQTDATCNGTATGTATAQGAGGTAPYNYQWDVAAANQTTATATGLALGVYTVVITDDNGCNTSTTVTISEPSAVNAAITSTTGAACNGVGTGSATAAGSGGVGPYTYLWPDAQTTATATNLAGGTYLVTVTDANGCTATATAIVTEPTAVLATIISTTDVSCNGGNDGAASLSVQGGTPTSGYTFQWSGAAGQNSPNATGLAAGIQTVTVTDANGCFDIDTFTINEPLTALSGYLTAADALCFGSATGELGAVIQGGTTPYTYSWNSSPVQTTLVADSLFAGTYIVNVSDANGCNVELTGVVGEPTELTITATILQNVTCFGGTNGAANVVTTAGGVGPYTYVWTDPSGQVGLSATNLSAGVVSVIVTDGNACTAMATVTLTEGTPITVTETVTNISCNGLTDGAINITGSNKVLVGYNWSTGAVGNPIIGLAAGTYTVTVTDAGGCQEVFSYTIVEPDPISLSIAQTSSILCHGAGNASAQVTATGGTAPYTVNWSNGATGSTATNLAPGTYGVTVTDSRGCFEVTSISIVQPEELTITGSTTGTLCAGDATGTLTAIGAGGTVISGLLEYSIDGSTWQNGNIFSGLASGIYTLSVRDENGCTVDTMLVVEDADPFFITSMTPNTTLEYLDSLTIEVVLNDTIGVTYSWQQISGVMGLVTDSTYSFDITPEDAVQYEFTATNSNGCTVDSIVIIEVTKPRRANAPTGFTPNGDGVNDYFFIQGGDKVEEITIFRVYDRWGTLVFEGNQMDINVAEQGWDGIYRGKPATSGTYTWYSDVLFKDGHTEQIKGNIILLR